MNIRALVSVSLVLVLVSSGALYAQAQSPVGQAVPIGSVLFSAGEKAELLIAQSSARTSHQAAESALIIRDSDGNDLATIDLPNLAALVAPSADGIMRWINSVTVEVVAGVLFVNGQAYAEIEADDSTSTPFFAKYRPQFYFRTTDVTGALPRATANILGPAGGTRATSAVADGFWVLLDPLPPSADTPTPVSLLPTESVAFVYQRIERSPDPSLRGETATLVFVDPFGQMLGSVDLSGDGPSAISAGVDGGELTVDGQVLGPVAADPTTGRAGFGVYLMLEPGAGQAADGASIRRTITITVFDQASGDTHATYECQLVGGQLPPGLTITGCAS